MTPKTRKRRTVLLASVILLLLWADCMMTGYVPGLFHHPRERWGEAALAILREADSVEVIRLDQPTSMPRDSANQPYYGMTAKGAPITPPDEWVSRMRDAVDDSWNYEWLWHARCLPRPGVCVRFRQGSQVVDLLFCFECDLVSLAPTGQLGERIQDRWIDFRVKRSPFTELVKEIFPNDAAIQGIGN